MKRLLLAGALIGATFACNAMDDGKKKYQEIVELKNAPPNKKAGRFTVKKVNDNLANNEYVQQNPKVLVDFALQILKEGLSEHGIYCITSRLTELNKKNARVNRGERFKGCKDVKIVISNFILYSKFTLAEIRIIELAREYDKKNTPELHERDLSEIKTKSKEFIAQHGSSFKNLVTSVAFSRKGGIALVVLVASYLGYSYWNNSKKTQQSN